MVGNTLNEQKNSYRMRFSQDKTLLDQHNSYIMLSLVH